jgi:hypothetical protein
MILIAVIVGFPSITVLIGCSEEAGSESKVVTAWYSEYVLREDHTAKYEHTA